MFSSCKKPIRHRAKRIDFSRAIKDNWHKFSDLSWSADWRVAIWHLLKSVESPRTSRGIDMMVSHYGLDDGIGKTLEEIGMRENPPLTRERARQLICEVLKEIDVVEKSAGYIGPKPFSEVRAWFKQNQVSSDLKFVKTKSLMRKKEVKGFINNENGLLSFLNDNGIRQITYRNTRYLYNKNDSRLNITQHIQSYRKRVRKENTDNKKNLMVKTVTYVPKEVKEDIDTTNKKLNISLNKMYENILLHFIEDEPWLGHEYFFERTESWKSRRGVSEWKQVGLYIHKDIYIRIKTTSKKIDVSVMAFIFRALAWGTSDDPSAKNIDHSIKKI